MYQNRDGAEFRRDISEPDGVQAHRWSFAQDSMIGVQMTARSSADLEATLQLISRNAIDVGYRPQVAWAFVKLMPAEDIAVRAGRLGIDLYMQGDSAEIGYANLLVRQPVIFNPRIFDGFDADWVRPVSDGAVRLKGQIGNATGRLVSGGVVQDMQGSTYRSLFAEYSRDGWTGRLATARLTLKNELTGADFASLQSALAAAPNGRAIAATLSMKDRPLTYVCAALAYDSGPLQGTASYSTTSSPDWSDLRAFYVEAGYRLGQFTPYAAYSRQSSARATIATGLPWGMSPMTDAINQGASLAQASVKTNQSDLALGVRYDLTRNTALKFQMDDIRYQDPSSIIDPDLAAMRVEQRGYRGMKLLSTALEFLF